jgi:hypothetical protein
VPVFLQAAKCLNLKTGPMFAQWHRIAPDGLLGDLNACPVQAYTPIRLAPQLSNSCPKDRLQAASKRFYGSVGPQNLGGFGVFENVKVSGNVKCGWMYKNPRPTGARSGVGGGYMKDPPIRPNFSRIPARRVQI